MAIRSLSSILLFTCLTMSCSATTFPPNFRPLWGFDHITVAGDGNVALSLDKQSGAGFISKEAYSSGKFSARMKLIPGDSAGTISTFYLSSNETAHNELDLEFRANLSGEPIILQTNIFVKDVGGREQGIKLWFDPTKEFHSYSIFWNEHLTLFLVDETVIRVHRNLAGVPYPGGQAMSAIGSLYNGQSWATQGGKVKINWNHAPFVLNFGRLEIAGAPAEVAELSPHQRDQLRWVQGNQMVYDYCRRTRDRAEARGCKENRAY